MKKIILFLLIVLQLLSCSNGVDYVKQKDKENHLIDFGIFSIITPIDFKYEKINGVDSYVGKIRNKKSIIFFDYGRYSPKPPMDKEQFIDDKGRYLDYESSQMFFNLINLKPYKNCEYYYTFDFEEKKYKIPFCTPQENLDNFKYYDIKIDTINNYKRTLSIWKNESIEKFSSVNLVPIHSDLNNNELWIGIKTDKKMKNKRDFEKC